jgi:hypothetical protein
MAASDNEHPLPVQSLVAFFGLEFPVNKKKDLKLESVVPSISKNIQKYTSDSAEP